MLKDADTYSDDTVNPIEHLTIVVPCYNEADTLPAFFKELTRIVKGNDCFSSIRRLTLLLVDDGSTDSTFDIIKEQAAQPSVYEIEYISFSRNFGKEAALYAGLKNAEGDYVVTMDADLQDPPSLLPKMIDLISEGDCDNVATRRITRKGEPPIRSFFAKMFYRIIHKVSDVEIMDGARDYRLMSRQMVDAIVSLSERTRFSKGIYGWVGFRTKWIEYENVERSAGETKWSFWKLFKYSIDGFVSFSVAPLQFASAFGAVLFIVAIVAIIIIAIKTLLFGDPVQGWPSMISVILLIGGIQLLSIGVLGQYLANIYTESKNRPLYIVKEQSGHKA